MVAGICTEFCKPTDVYMLLLGMMGGTDKISSHVFMPISSADFGKQLLWLYEAAKSAIAEEGIQSESITEQQAIISCKTRLALACCVQ